jgi:hypothetical protein
MLRARMFAVFGLLTSGLEILIFSDPSTKV